MQRHCSSLVLPSPIEAQKADLTPIQLWNREYLSLRTIPSTTRTVPSKALLLYSELIPYAECPRVLDAGCGAGRNAIYLARRGCHVTAVDFAHSALNLLQQTATEHSLLDSIAIHE